MSERKIMKKTEEQYSDGTYKYLHNCYTCGAEEKALGKLKATKPLCHICKRLARVEGSRKAKEQRALNGYNNKWLTTLLGTTGNPTQEAVCEIFHYEPEGVLTYKETYHSRSLKGTVAGVYVTKGYRYVSVNSKRYLVHRLIWTYHNGNIPEGYVIDHKDRDTTHNAICNLRCISETHNKWNNNAKGYTKAKGKFRAQIKANGKEIPLGTFNTKEEASEAYLQAKKKYHVIVEYSNDS